MTSPMENLVSRDSQALAEASAWIARLANDGVSGDDGLEFDAWLAAAPQNRDAYSQALVLMMELDARADAVLAELAQADRSQTVVPITSARRRRPMNAWWAGAGGAAIAAGLAVTLLPAYLAGPLVTTYATDKGQHQHITLADGSKLDLDAETHAVVTYSRGERRIALSDGQAIFDVTHDANRPFVVEAAGRQVRDLGTQFDVKAHGQELTITVARGRVEVAGTAGHGIDLSPGQRLSIDKTGVGRLSAVDPAETFSWRSGRLVYPRPAPGRGGRRSEPPVRPADRNRRPSDRQSADHRGDRSR
jgi:transmembrane sensor